MLDTNVLVAAMKSAQGASYRLLAQIDRPNWKLHVSTPLVLEYEAILKRQCLHLSTSDIEAIVDYLCLIAEKHKIFYLWRPLLRDPNDDHVLELAVKAGATIVTWNVRDFILARTRLGVSVMTPRELLIQEASK